MTEKPTVISPYRILFATTDDRDKFLCDPISRGLWLDSSPVTAQWADIDVITDEHLVEVEVWLIQNCPGAKIGVAADIEPPTIFGMDKDEFYTAVSLLKQIFSNFESRKIHTFVQREVFGNVLDAAFAGKEPTVEEMQAAGKRARDLADAFIAGASPDDEGDEGDEG